MQSQIWHQMYPSDVAFDAPFENDLTIPAMVAQRTARYKDNVAFSCLEVQLSYQALDEFSYLFAGYLCREGLLAGDRVALMLPNSLTYPICSLGILRAGMTMVSVNPMYTARELIHQLNDSGAKAIVCSESLLPLVSEIASATSLRHVVFAALTDLIPTGDSWRPVAQRSIGEAKALGTALEEGAPGGFNPPIMRPEDIAVLQYTGGTTGVSKGAALSHKNLLCGVAQQISWLPQAYIAGNTTCITALPMYHVFPLNIMLMMLWLGGTNRLVPNPRDSNQIFSEIKRAPFHVLPGVNTFFNSLLASDRLLKEDFAATRLVIGAGASVLESVAERWKTVTGIPLTEGYGLTECSPGVTFNLHSAGWTGSVGVPFPSTDVKIIDNGGLTVPLGSSGELCVKGPQVFTGYWRKPEETKNVFTEDGWFRTGDIARMDHRGMVYIVDRLKDMILVSAFNVYPNEIEGVVSMLPAVDECACIGVPDARSGEVPHLFIVRRDLDITAEEVIRHCRENLTAYKVPRYVTFLPALPKSPVGKILRRELRDTLRTSGVTH
ncbi:AMP-binding protein [Caballeronia sp. 15715]|uniref:AMP-binding protein n=1 Tax=Caballeronia sp. 15715 TaxID=3391030 RepID=UPI0039E2EB88